MTDQYKIHSIWYSKPHFTRDGHGEVLHYRIGITITVGGISDYDGLGMKKVTGIEFNNDTNSFRIYYDKGGLKIIPMATDTEVTYQDITETKKK